MVTNKKPKKISPQKGPQTEFLSNDADVIIYGGAAGGGKTFALLLDPLRHIPNNAVGCVFFRRTSTQITNEGGLWDEAKKLYLPLKGKTRERPNLDITFPNKENPNRDGLRISFRHLQHEKDVHSYQGAQIGVIYFDELTHFTENQFQYMLSRNRSLSGIKPYIRCSTNPDKSSWVRSLIDWWIGEDGFPIKKRSGKKRWLVTYEDQKYWFNSKSEANAAYPEGSPISFTFIPSKLDDNKILMKQDPGYKAKLMALNKVDRERLLGGNWDVMPLAGMYFKREYFEEIEFAPPFKRIVRCWDRAATEWIRGIDSESKKPDATAGVKIGQTYDDQFVIIDVIEERYSSGKVEALIKNTAIQDGVICSVKGFQDPGSAGKSEAENFIKMLSGFHVTVERIAVDKITAAKPFSAQAEPGNIKILKSCRNKELFYSQLENFPKDSHDDIVDASSGAFNELNASNVGAFTKKYNDISMKRNIPTPEQW